MTKADTTITINIELTPSSVTPPGGQGSIRGAVTKARTDSAVVGALAVLAEFQMTGGVVSYVPIDSMRTDTAGLFRFDSLENGQYQISVIAAGYRSEAQQTAITANMRERTLNFSLTPIEVGSIAVRVTADSAKGAAIAGAKVGLSLRMGGGALTTLDSGLTATADTYRDFSRQVTIGQPAEADTTNYNFKMVRLTTRVIAAHVARVNRPSAVFCGSTLIIRGVQGKADVAVYCAQGRCVYRAAFAKETYAAPLRTIVSSPGKYIVKVNGCGVSLAYSLVAR